VAKSYNEAGVRIRAGEEFVRDIRDKVRSTFSESVLGDLGGFGALFDGRFQGLKDPVLVSSVDGVGTKLKVAFLMDKHDTIGQDLVNHCVNDVAVCGARPLFFLDYFATGRLLPAVAKQVIAGMVKACRENSCALIGGETAEMPGFYRENEYDLAGMIVGVAEKSELFDKQQVRAGDSLIGLPSTGLHTNGFSLARSILFDKFDVEDFIDELGMRLGESLLAVHRSYLKAIRAISGRAEVHGIAHVTGGGITGNTSRVIPRTLGLKIDWKRWSRPPIFGLIQREGRVSEKEMRATFNLGAGLVIIASKAGTDRVMRALRASGEAPFLMGEVCKA
jgi:phosphoribosylformylglycinamidine cyclo-ligase